DCVFAQNSAPSGGAIYNQGNFLADSSEFTGNQSFARSQDYASGGGAFYNASGEVEFTRCSFSNNTAAGVSGAFENPSDVNAGSGVGGAVYVLAGNAGFTDTLIAGNAALGGSGGMYQLNHYSGNGGSAL